MDSFRDFPHISAVHTRTEVVLTSVFELPSCGINHQNMGTGEPHPYGRPIYRI